MRVCIFTSKNDRAHITVEYFLKLNSTIIRKDMIKSDSYLSNKCREMTYLQNESICYEYQGHY